MPKNVIFTSNHGSFVDAIALMAAVPANSVFIAKKELLRAPFIVTFMKKMNHIFVSREDFSESVGGMAAMQSILAKGDNMVIFPEATFTATRGLLPFKLGAFKLAVDSGKSICPIALKGTRDIWRAGEFLTGPGIIHVTICEPIAPMSNDFVEVTRLRDKTRETIAKYCGEAPLGH